MPVYLYPQKIKKDIASTPWKGSGDILKENWLLKAVFGEKNYRFISESIAGDIITEN